MKIDWKRKLTSRKLWMAIAEFVTMLIVAFGGSESEATQVAALIMAGAGMIAYIIGEGLADAGNAGTNIIDEITVEDETEKTEAE